MQKLLLRLTSRCWLLPVPLMSAANYVCNCWATHLMLWTTINIDATDDRTACCVPPSATDVFRELRWRLLSDASDATNDGQDRRHWRPCYPLLTFHRLLLTSKLPAVQCRCLTLISATNNVWWVLASFKYATWQPNQIPSPYFNRVVKTYNSSLERNH